VSWFGLSSTYSLAAFGISVLAVSAIFTLAAVSKLSGRFEFWPPPAPKSWQHRTFLALFRLFLYPLVILSFLEFQTANEATGLWWQAIGGLLFVVGFGLALRITLQMGWRNAFGEKKGLVTDGWFAISRNPVYVVTWIDQVGWGLILAQWSVTVLLALWALLYVLAPFLEERWLEQEYGDDFPRYKSNVARFL
jgi:protein-S-isoprenylcysteine O-methyltransferase Ste14